MKRVRHIKNIIMKIKHLVKKHQKLLKSNSFLNNQNYVLWNYSKSKVHLQYKSKSFAFKHKDTIINWFTVLGFPFFMYGGIIVNVKIICIWLVLMFIPRLIYFVSKNLSVFWYFQKYHLDNKKFIWKRYIFRKRIKSKINKRDYIIFKK